LFSAFGQGLIKLSMLDFVDEKIKKTKNKTRQQKQKQQKTTTKK